MKAGPRLAIDFGTTRTKVAYYDTDREEARLVELGISQREIIPSVFYVPKKDAGQILVGDDAMAQLDIDPAGIVREIKREIDKLGKKRCGAGRLSPTRVDLAAELLRTIRRRCEDGVFHGQIIDKCTLTVPVSFTESQRSKLVEAANLAGFNDVRLMDEPTAAARAWVEKQGEKFGDHVVVVDIGGGTTDFSVVEWSNNRFTPHSSVLPDGFLQGGNDIDDHACDEILAQQEEENEELVLRLKDSFLVKLRNIKEQFARGLKRQSISAGSARLEIQPSVFRAAETEFVNRLCDELQAFFEKCKHGGIESPVVLLVGGASRISGLAEMLNEICPRQVFTWESADFATVLGAVEYPGNETGFESAKQRKAQASYIEALKAAIADDKITASEFDYLMSRREQLGLSDEIATNLEVSVIGHPIAETQAHTLITRIEVDELIGDGRAIEALQRTTQAMIERPTLDLFELWNYATEPIAEGELVMQQARSILAKRGDLWGRCCVACGLADTGRTKEANAYYSENIYGVEVSSDELETASIIAEVNCTASNEGNLKEQIATLEELLEKCPTSHILRMLHAIAIAETEPERAYQSINEALNTTPLSVGVRMMKIFFDIGSDRLTDSDLDEHCRILNRVSKDHWVSKLARSLKAMRRENFKLALNELMDVPEHPQIREINEMQSFAYFLRGTCHLNLEEIAEARRDVLESVSCHDGSPAFFLHGEFLFQDERYAEAKQAYLNAAKQDPSDPGIQCCVGWACANLLEFDEAKTWFLKTLKSNIEDLAAQNGLMVSIVLKRHVADSCLHFFPNIPDNLLQNAFANYGCIDANPEIWSAAAIYDNTFWGSAKAGLAIANNGLTWKNSWEEPQRVWFADIKQIQGPNSSGNLVLNNTLTLNVSMGDSSYAIASFLRDALLELGVAWRDIQNSYTA